MAGGKVLGGSQSLTTHYRGFAGSCDDHGMQFVFARLKALQGHLNINWPYLSAGAFVKVGSVTLGDSGGQ